MLLARIYEVFPLRCPRCGEPMRLIAFVTDSGSITRILAYTATGTGGLASRRPGARPCVTLAPTATHNPAGASPNAPSCRHADHPITDRPVRRNSTSCKTALNVLSFSHKRLCRVESER
jgi:hypothetical protein